jgi:hypothetical protein
MEPQLGTVSFFLLCVQFAREQGVELGSERSGILTVGSGILTVGSDQLDSNPGRSCHTYHCSARRYPIGLPSYLM